jgi:hypothetical protein
LPLAPLQARIWRIFGIFGPRVNEYISLEPSQPPGT